jgi:hypothetical protein
MPGVATKIRTCSNVMGDLDTVRRKAAVLRGYSEGTELTHLSTVLVGDDDRHLAELLDPPPAPARPRHVRAGGQRRHGRRPRRAVPGAGPTPASAR